MGYTSKGNTTAISCIAPGSLKPTFEYVVFKQYKAFVARAPVKVLEKT
jgi:hypothetical protein